jgi:tetratricopeptide (TPR) repeat protein
MRLLHFDALGRLVLTDFRGKTTPPYAILSHRWSDSEILIEDISSGTYKEKEEGYRKLQFCAERAAQDELQYFWIDTCCIDRWNNNERSKAINSMFQWYKAAARCYVYLSDVSVSTATEPVQRSDWEASFRASAWFTRGWTLQELIAPVLVEFFSREGHLIGDKASLNQLLHDITGIPLVAMRNCPLHEFSTSERERWAEKRITTEEEDIVYCLLGLLGISMPITYGEGEGNARRRLQAEIEAAGSAPSIIPFSRNQSFVGRESQLAKIEAELFSNDQTTTTLVIVGPGGTGKSQLALEAAYRTKQNSRSCSVFWVDASDIDSLYRSYASVAQKLSVPGCDDDQADIKQVVKRCVAAIGARRCLLIYDNVEGTTLRPSGSSTTQGADLADFLPHSKLCSVIFTTTKIDTAEALAPQNVTALHELTPDTALRMLQNRLTTPLSNAEQQEAMHLLEELSYLPLAIAQGAAHMNASGMTVQQYQAELAKHKAAALEYSDDSSEGELRETGLRTTIAATLSVSLSQVRHSNAVAADYLFLAACVDRKDISLDLLDAASPQAREDAIKVLDRYALVTRRPADSALDIHRLVHYAVGKRLQAEGILEKWIERTIKQLLWVFPNDHHSNRSKWRRLLPHAQCVLSHTQRDDDEDRLDLARKCARALYSDGQYKAAEELQVEVMETSKRVLGDEHPDTLTSIANLASTYGDQGRWDEVEELEVEVMKTSKRVLGEEHPDTLTSIANLASTYGDQGRWDEVEELQVEVMETSKRVLGDEHPDTLTSMNNLASTYWNQGRWDKAEELQVEVMKTRKRVLDDEHPSMLTSIANLASTYMNQGRMGKAEELQVEVMKTNKRVLGDEHPDTLISMNNLALTYMNQGRWCEAEELQVEVMETSKRVLDDEHPYTLSSIANLASTYGDQGRWDKAEELQVAVMKTSKRVLGDEHPDTLSSMNNLASTYWDQGRWDEAEELQAEVIETRKRVLGDEHPDTLTSIANLALTYWNQGRWDKAEEPQVAVMQTRKRVLGDEHPDTLSSMNNLASTYWDQGRWDEAEELQMEVMEKSKRVLGDEHPSTLTSMHNLAFTLWSRSRHIEAIALMEICLQSRRKVLGEQHPSTQLSLDALAGWRNDTREEQ